MLYVFYSVLLITGLYTLQFIGYSNKYEKWASGFVLVGLFVLSNFSFWFIIAIVVLVFLLLINKKYDLINLLRTIIKNKK